MPPGYCLRFDIVSSGGWPVVSVITGGRSFARQRFVTFLRIVLYPTESALAAMLPGLAP
jgi:hypothetical protein